MKKILIIVPLSTIDWGSKNAGGVDSVCQMLVAELAQSGCTNFYYRILAFDPNNDVSYTGQVIRLSDNLEIIRCPGKEKFFGLSLSGLVSSNVRVAQQIKIFKPDIVHTHLVSWLLGAYKAKITIATLHSYKTIGRNSVSFINDIVYEKIIPKIADFFTDYYTVVGQALADELIKYTKKSVVVIANPINKIFSAPEVSPECKTKTSSAIKMVTCAGITRKKRIHLAIELLNSLRLNNIDATLTVVGPPTDRVYLDELKILANSLGVSDYLYFAGRCNQEKVADYYKNSDLGVFLSSEETFGLAPLEMMASGLPVISSCVGVLAERTADFSVYKSVYIVNVDDVSIPLEQIISVKKSNPALAQEYIKLNFTAKGVTQEYETVYHEVLNCSRV